MVIHAFADLHARRWYREWLDSSQLGAISALRIRHDHARTEGLALQERRARGDDLGRVGLGHRRLQRSGRWRQQSGHTPARYFLRQGVRRSSQQPLLAATARHHRRDNARTPDGWNVDKPWYDAQSGQLGPMLTRNVD